MIPYETYCQIRALSDQGMNLAQIARALQLHVDTVRRWLGRDTFTPRKPSKRPSKLDPFKDAITRMLAHHPYSARQIYQKLQADFDYSGGISILRDYLRRIRPPKTRARLVLRFAPGEAVQIDWGECGLIPVGNTRRKLSFLCAVLCHSRLIHVQFALTQKLELFLSGIQDALHFFGGSPRRLIIDNLKTGVLSHRPGLPPTFHPRLLELCAHYHIEPVACNPRAPYEKGRVENGVGYVKNNLLAGLPLSSLDAVNAAAQNWLSQTANRRLHSVTGKIPADHFLQSEKAALRPLPLVPYDCGLLRQVRATHTARVVWETNRYSVPPTYAGASLLLKIRPTEILVYGDPRQDKLIATHPRSYARRDDIEDPAHVAALLSERRTAREGRLLLDFLRLSPIAEIYYRNLEERTPNPRLHARKILALSQQYGTESTARALADAHAFLAYSSDYVANLLESRARLLPENSPLHLTRRADLLDIELPRADLSPYHQIDTQKLPI